MKAILAADDDAAICQLLHDALSEVPGWTVTAVANGADLLELAAAVLPSLVLLDVNMPGIDGIETYRLLRQRDETRDVPTLFLTATPERVAEAGLSGPYAYLPKPFLLDDLLACVANLLGEPLPDI